MSELRENVIVVTPSGQLRGELFVGKDGLPELEVLGGGYHEKGCYTPATLPNVWAICGMGCSGPLFLGWVAIWDIRSKIRDAQQEAEEQREPDCIDLAKSYMEAHGER